MPGVTARKNEHFSSLLRRFKRSVEKDDTLNELRKREFYEKPSALKKRAKKAAAKRWHKQQRMEQLPQRTH